MPEEPTATVNPFEVKRSSWLTPKRAIIGIVVVVVLVGAVMTILDAQGIAAQSTGIAIQMTLLAVFGVVAGITGAQLRKKGNWQTALTAYRVAVWCLFLAFWASIQFHQETKREEFIRRLDEMKQIESREKAK